MDISRAREIVATLAEGVDPLTGEVLPSDHICNQGEVVRALYTLLNDKSPTKKSQPENAGMLWTAEADNELKKMYEKRTNIAEISKYLGRTTGAIKSRLNKLGLMQKDKDFSCY